MKAYTELIRHGGNQKLFRAIEMSVLAMQVNRPLHIHAEGLRGTGKTTVLRAARDLLPPMQRILGCRYNCHPLQPHCPEHFHLSPEEVAAIGIEQVPRPFLEISHSAKIGTVVGSIDLAKLTDSVHPTASILPGTIPQAHRGIIFIDEINRLADTSPELADVLLDVMGTKPGQVQIEESGLPTVQIPVQVSVWAASNPDEEPGPLEHIRRQLSDRFDLVIRMGRPTEMDVVQNILQQSQIYRVNPRRVICTDPVTDLWQQQQKFRAIGAVFDQVRMSEMIKNIIANIYLDFGLESLRAVEAMELGSRVHAALENRHQVLIEDLVAIMPLILAHRVDLTTLENVLKYLDYAHFTQSIPKVPDTIEKKTEPRMITGMSSLASAPPIPQQLAEESGSPGHAKASGLWNKLKKAMRNRFQAAGNTKKTAGYQKTVPQQPGSSEVRREWSKENPRGLATAPSSIRDPEKMPVMAPPETARPLTDLPIKQYVCSEEETKHEC